MYEEIWFIRGDKGLKGVSLCVSVRPSPSEGFAPNGPFAIANELPSLIDTEDKPEGLFYVFTFDLRDCEIFLFTCRARSLETKVRRAAVQNFSRRPAAIFPLEPSFRENANA